MSPDTVFTMAGQLVLPCWILLVAALFLVRVRPLARFAARYLAPGLLGGAYALLLVSHGGSADGDFGSLEGVARLFSTREVLLAGWLHYLAFDLFVGAWMVEDTLGVGLPRAAALVSLPLCFLAGPVGLLVHLGVRGSVLAWRRR